MLLKCTLPRRLAASLDLGMTAGGWLGVEPTTHSSAVSLLARDVVAEGFGFVYDYFYLQFNDIADGDDA